MCLLFVNMNYISHRSEKMFIFSLALRARDTYFIFFSLLSEIYFIFTQNKQISSIKFTKHRRLKLSNHKRRKKLRRVETIKRPRHKDTICLNELTILLLLVEQIWKVPQSVCKQLAQTCKIVSGKKVPRCQNVILFN